jgi:hypothetical protein
MLGCSFEQGVCAGAIAIVQLYPSENDVAARDISAFDPRLLCHKDRTGFVCLVRSQFEVASKRGGFSGAHDDLRKKVRNGRTPPKFCLQWDEHR